MTIGSVAVEYAWTTEIRPWQWSHLCWAKRFSLTALGQAGCGHKRLSRRAVGKPVFLSLFYWVPWKTRLWRDVLICAHCLSLFFSLETFCLPINSNLLFPTSCTSPPPLLLLLLLLLLYSLSIPSSLYEFTTD